MIECIPWPSPRSASSSTRSSRRTAVLLTRYWPSPPRWSRRATESSAVVDGQRPVVVVEEELDLAEVGRAARSPPPAKRTSSGFSARSSVGLSEPAAQRIASATFDLPEPFGPTITPTPGSRRTSTGSGNDLKPRSLTARRCTARHPKEAAGRYCGCARRRRARAERPRLPARPRTKISRIPRGSESSSSSVSRRKRSSEFVGFRSAMRPEGCQKLRKRPGCRASRAPPGRPPARRPSSSGPRRARAPRRRRPRRT